MIVSPLHIGIEALQLVSIVGVIWYALSKHVRVLPENSKHNEIENSLKAIVNVLSSKSIYYKGHSKRVSLIAGAICDSMHIKDEAKNRIVEAGALHDIGKIRLDLSLLDKVEKLTECEYEKIKDHCIVGHDILKEFDVESNITTAILYHHENFDGTGYPIQIGGENIPLAARILRVADSIDAMGSDRAYRKGLPFAAIVKELENGSGTEYDPNIVAVCTNGLSNRIKLILAQQKI